MLKISPLVLGYGHTPVARFAGLDLPDGAQCLLMGSSGSGKTTLLHTLAGLLTPLEGNIVIAGEDFSRMTESGRDRFRGRNIGLIFQTLHLMPSLSVLANLELASYAAGIAVPEKRAETALRMLGLWDKRDTLPESLSQGQRQRVAIARAIMNRPTLILADEPTSSLDDDACKTVIELIMDAAKETGAALVISTHDQRLRSYFPMILGLEHAP